MTKLAPGWLQDDELELHEKYLREFETYNLGGAENRIVEAGCFGGKLFSYLQPLFPTWEYVGVNPWDGEHGHVPFNWEGRYRDDDIFLKPELQSEETLMTQDKFIKNCPYAEVYNGYFEDFTSGIAWRNGVKFNVISMGQISDHIDWKRQYKCAAKLLSKTGVIIARNLLSVPEVVKIIENDRWEILDYSKEGRNAAIRPRR
jgi:hypothetical protein